MEKTCLFETKQPNDNPAIPKKTRLNYQTTITAKQRKTDDVPPQNDIPHAIRNNGLWR